MSVIEEGHGPLSAIMVVVCTDRGQHKRTRLADVRWYAADYWRMTAPVSKKQSFYPPASAEGENGSYIFDCPRCTRTPYFARLKWVELMEGRFHPRNWNVDEDGSVSRAEFDVSTVPF